MKKQNRIAKKPGIAPLPTQSRNRRNAGLSIENEIASAETGYTEQQCLYRTGGGYRLVTEFTEVFEDGAWIRAHEWRLRKDPSLTPLEMGRFEPFELLPRERLRRRRVVSHRITRAEAAEWLNQHIIKNLVPREFHEELAVIMQTKLREIGAKIGELKQRGAARSSKSKNAIRRLTPKEKLLWLLKLPANATGKAIDAAIASATR